MTTPRYQNIDSNRIPEITRKDGVKIRIIAGESDGVSGSVSEIYADPAYLDELQQWASGLWNSLRSDFQQRRRDGWIRECHGDLHLAYVFEGKGTFGNDDKSDENSASHPCLVVFGDGDYIQASTSNQPVRFLVVTGKPLNEPIARHGPFVMNTQEEIQQALDDLQNGTFVKS